MRFYYKTQPNLTLTRAYLHGLIDGRRHMSEGPMYHLHGLVDASGDEVRDLDEQILRQSYDYTDWDARPMGMSWVDKYWGSRAEMQAYLHGYLDGYDRRPTTEQVNGIWAIWTRADAQAVIDMLKGVSVR